MNYKSNDNRKIDYPEFYEISKDIYSSFVGDLFENIDEHWTFWSMSWIRRQLAVPDEFTTEEIRAMDIAKRLLMTGRLCNIDSKERAPLVAMHLPKIEKYLTGEISLIYDMPDFEHCILKDKNS
jgi:hypothetical protein